MADKLNERSQKVLDAIRLKTAEELRKDEIAFLRARISYLTLDDKDKFKSVLEDKPPLYVKEK